MPRPAPTSQVLTLDEIAHEFGMTNGAIAGIAYGKTWTTLPWPPGVRYRRRRADYKRPSRFGRVLTPDNVRQIKADIVADELTFQELAKRYGVLGPAISSIASGRTWRKVPWPGNRRDSGRALSGRSTKKALRGVLRPDGSRPDRLGGEAWAEER